MFELSLQWLAAVIDVSAKAVLLAAIAALFLRVTRLRDGNLRHRAWTGVLIGMLLLPVLAQTVPALQIPLPLPDDWAIDESSGEQPADLDVAPVKVTTENLADLTESETVPAAASPAIEESSITGEIPGEADLFTLRDERNGREWAGAGAPTEPVDDARLPVVELKSDEPEPAAISVPPTDKPRPARWPVVVFGVWVAGAFLLAVRLLFGLGYSLHLGWNSTVITGEELVELGIDPRDLSYGKRDVAIFECPLISVPLALGVVRPRILLPSEWLTWPAEKLHAVIAHERTHIQRRDGAVIFLAELNRCLYWFHPLAWWLRSHLGQLAETACDDAAIDSTGDRTTYARHLLEVASAVSGRRTRLISNGISMARSSNVESRINAILDLTRPLSRRLTWATSLMLLGVLIPIITLAAAVRPSPGTKPHESQEGVQAAVAPDGERDDSLALVTDDSAADKPTTAAKPETSQPTQSPAEKSKLFTINAIVVDPEGKPVSGATVRIIHSHQPRWRAAPTEVTVLKTLTTPDDGRFEYELPLDDLSSMSNVPIIYRDRTSAIATAPGFGFAFATFSQSPDEKPVELKLAPPQLIRGRLVDLEGRPIAGASVRVFTVALNQSSKEIDEWLAAIPEDLAVGKKDIRMRSGAVTGPQFPGRADRQLSPVLFPQLKTDDEGRFELSGLGRDRVAVLQITGPGLAQSTVEVLARPLERPVHADLPFIPGNTKVFYGADFTFVAAPSAPVTGVLRDIDTHQPIAGAKVMSRDGYIITETDAQGRYSLRGLPIEEGNELTVVADGQPYLITGRIKVPVSRELQPVKKDIELPRAVWATGRLFDESTGEPVQGTLYFTPFHGNRLAERYPQYADRLGRAVGFDRDYPTDAEGRFRIPVTPGRGVLCAKTNSKIYRTGYGAEEIPELAPFLKKPIGGRLPTFHPLPPTFVNALREIDPPADAEEITINLPVDRGVSLDLAFVDPAGQPLTGVSVWGAGVQPASNGRVTLVGLTAGVSTTISAEYGERNLVARFYIVPRRNADPMTIVLYPPTIVRGRLIDAQGKPLWHASISINFTSPSGQHYSAPGISADDNGEFSAQLPPGEEYDLISRAGRMAPLIKDLKATPGKTVDLGDLVIDADAEQFAPAVPKWKPIITEPEPAKLANTKGNAAAAAGGNASQDDQAKPGSPKADPEAAQVDGPAIARSYSGLVQTPKGEPLAGATIWLAVTSYAKEVEGSIQRLGTSDEQGRFHVTLDESAARKFGDRFSYSAPNLVATAAGRGPDWLPLEAFNDNPTPGEKQDALQLRIDTSFGTGRFASRSLKLRAEDRPVHGRLIDLDGRPLPNVTVIVEQLMQPDIPLLLKAFKEISRQGVYDAYNAVRVGGLTDEALQKLIPPVKTDGNGEFELTGIGNDQLATLTFAAERVQAQLVYVLGRTMETVRLPHVVPEGAKDVYAGREFTYVLGPSVPIEGVVKDYKTGTPIPQTIVYVERLFGSDQNQLRLASRHMRSVTDARGRFRITGLPPGEGHLLEAMPPKEEPYLMASQDVLLKLEDAPAKQIEIQVVKGIWIEGRVTDARSGKPLSAYVDHLFLQKNPNTLDKIGLRQAWQMHRYHTDGDGRYRVPALPGPGLILVRADGKYPLAVGAETVDGYEADNGYIPTSPIALPLSNWNLIKPIDPAQDATSFTCDVTLDAGETVPGRVVGPDGKPVSNFSALGEVANAPFWNPKAKGNFSVEGYDGEGPRQLFFKNQDESLVAQYRLQGKAPTEIVVTLQPAVRVTGRLIENENDLPAEEYRIFCDKSSLYNEKYPRVMFRVDNCRTDNDGRFEIKGLLAGVVYDMNASNPRHFVNNRNRFKIDLTNAKPGDVIDLGDVTGPNAKRPDTKNGDADSNQTR